MLRISKLTDYATVVMAALAERPGERIPASRLAEITRLETPTVAKVLKALAAGSLVGSGTIANKDESRGASCLAEKRVLEVVRDGQASTPFMQFGDTVRIEMFDERGESIFGAIEQTVERYRP